MESVTTQSAQVQLRINAFVRSVYNWMGLGLTLTGLIALFVASTPDLYRYVYANRLIFFGLIIAELAIVFTLSARINKMRASTATAMFLLYAALNGLTMAFVFIIYTASSIASTFFVCSATFVACSIFGWTTRRDLTSLGGFLMMGLIGIIIASVVNLFIGSNMISTVVSYVGVLVFVGLTAYDTQYIKNMAISQPEGLEAGVMRRGAIIGALKLYLDFINLFLMLLRIMGNRN
jgi:FtsH-binding integral membrane protein